MRAGVGLGVYSRYASGMGVCRWYARRGGTWSIQQECGWYVGCCGSSSSRMPQHTSRMPQLSPHVCGSYASMRVVCAQVWDLCGWYARRCGTWSIQQASSRFVTYPQACMRPAVACFTCFTTSTKAQILTHPRALRHVLSSGMTLLASSKHPTAYISCGSMLYY